MQSRKHPQDSVADELAEIEVNESITHVIQTFIESEYEISFENEEGFFVWLHDADIQIDVGGANAKLDLEPDAATTVLRATNFVVESEKVEEE